MRPVLKKLGKLTLQLLSIFLIVVACGKDDRPEVSDPTPKTDPENPVGVVQDSTAEESPEVDPDLVTQSLILDNMKIIKGELPSSKTSKTMPEDLKIDSDTIFWAPIESLEQRIIIKKPFGLVVASAWFYVPGADSYIEATFREDEESDEYEVLYFGFNPSAFPKLPLEFPVKIVPLDDAGTPLDEFEVPVVIEELKDTDNGNWTVSSIQRWYWKSTKDSASKLKSFPFKKDKTPGTTPGCCIGGQSEPNGFCSDANTKILDYETIGVTKSMFFHLFPEGNIIGYENSEYQNLDIWGSDFCSNSAAYFVSHGETFTKTLPLDIEADYRIEDRKLIIENVKRNETRMGIGPTFEFTLLSDHFLEGKQVASPDSPDGLGTLKQLYAKATYVITAEGDRDWFD